MDLVYRDDIYNSVKNALDDFAYHSNIPNRLYSTILSAVRNAPSTFWHQCTETENVPPLKEEVLVSLEHRNGKKEVAFAEYWGDNIDQNVAYWGGMNEDIRAWAKVPDFYEGEK